LEKLLYKAHASAVIDEGCSIGAGTSIWHFSHLMTGCTVGQDCNIGQNVFLAGGVSLGKNVKVQNNVSVYAGVICEDDVFLGPSMVFTNVLNPRSAIPRKEQYKKTLVKKGASIGANATILCGITIGKYAMIGAAAVIVKSVPDYGLVIGNPGRQTGWVSEFGHTLTFGSNNLACCKESGEWYVLEEGAVRKKNV
jgi:UDP-2-acetamido-3-amino-2,3-dideoxy-glucuronate N-acetyltransferase